MGKTVIEIDVTEEAGRYQEEEPNLSTPENMVRVAQEGGHKPYTMGQHLCIAKHRDETFDDVPEHKPTMFIGYGNFYSSFVASMKERVTLKNGKTVMVRSLVMPVSEAGHPDDDEQQVDVEVDSEPAAVDWATDMAVDRSTRYLLNRVIGYIVGRLNIIAANDGDARSVWNDLADKVEVHLAGLD